MMATVMIQCFIFLINKYSFLRMMLLLRLEKILVGQISGFWGGRAGKHNLMEFNILFHNSNKII